MRSYRRHSLVRPDAGNRIGLVSPAQSFLIGSCVFLSTAVWLGAEWPRLPALGMPFGVWVVAVGFAGVTLLQWIGSNRETAAGAESGSETTGPRRASPVTTTDSKSRVTSTLSMTPGQWWSGALNAGWRSLRRACSSLATTNERLAAIERRWCARIDRRAESAGPLRVGVSLPPEQAAALVAESGTLPLEWMALPSGQGAQQALEEHHLDAVIRSAAHGPSCLMTKEHPGQDGFWYDWSRARPLSYASVFGARVDPSQVTLDLEESLAAGGASVVRAVVETAAALSRTPARLSLSDRLRGRLPWSDSSEESSLLRLAETLAAPGVARTSAAQAGARAVGAWLTSTQSPVNIETRRRLVEATSELLGEEPESLLRLAAVRFAAWDDGAALDALLRADRAIRAGGAEPVVDHLAFLQAEVELGVPDPMTLGRVAAGICLVCSSGPAERIPYIRDDISDDLRYSGWLIGRDQDRALLMEVFRALERARSEAAPLRAAA